MTSPKGTTELPIATSRSATAIRDLFTKNPKTYYTQAELVESWKLSNPRINKILRNLVEEGLVGRTRVGSKYYYRLS